MAKRKPLNHRQKELLRDALLDRRRALKQSYQREIALAPAPVFSWPADEEETCRAISDTEMQYAIAGIHAATLAEVETALGKLHDGSYGRCEHCHAPIPKARLRVQPAATLCVPCKGAAEREAMPAEDKLVLSMAPVVNTRPPAAITNDLWRD